MPRNHDVFVIAGQAGSKSTFIGGLYQYSSKLEEYGVHYTPVEGDVRNDFIDGVIKQMLSRNEYPEQTEQGYVVKLTLDGGGTAVPETNINFVDIPGEQIGEVLPKAIDDIQNGGIDEEQVGSDFEQVKSEIGGNQQLTVDNWVTIFEYYYSQASMVIFLLNIHKLMVEDENLSITSDWLETTSEIKVKTAVVPTAVDLLGYDPDDPGFKSMALLSVRDYDSKLSDEFEDKLPSETAPHLNNLLQSADSHNQIDFFSVSVPAANPGIEDDNRLQSNNQGGFVTKGFDKVIEWLKE